MPRAERLGRLEDDGVMKRLGVWVREREPLVRHEDEWVADGKGDRCLDRIAAAKGACVTRLLVRDEAAKFAQPGERHHRERVLERRHLEDRMPDPLLLAGVLPISRGAGQKVPLPAAARVHE